MKIIDEKTITITRELIYDIIKRMCACDLNYDREVYNIITNKGAAYEYDDDKEFDTVLRNLTPEDLENLLLKI